MIKTELKTINIMEVSPSNACPDCVDCSEFHSKCLACTLQDYLNDSFQTGSHESLSLDDQSGPQAASSLAPSDSAGTAEAVTDASESSHTAPVAPMAPTNRYEVFLTDLLDAFLGNDEAGGLPGARQQGPPSPSFEQRKRPAPERKTPEIGKRSRSRVCSTPVPCNNGENGRQLVELAMQAARAGNIVAEAAYLFRASGQTDGANKDGNVYKYARYIGEIGESGISRVELLSQETRDKEKVAETVREISASHSSVSMSAAKIYFNYDRAVSLYRTLSSSFATDAE